MRLDVCAIILITQSLSRISDKELLYQISSFLTHIFGDFQDSFFYIFKKLIAILIIIGGDPNYHLIQQHA